MAKLIDITNQRFGRLVAVRVVKSQQGKTMWLCQCDCGKPTVVSSQNLRKGITKSCGCLHSEQLAARNKARAKHGKEKSRLYGVWRGMKQRCYDKNRKEYPDYGGRGISICPEWKNDFAAFQKWAFDNGYDETAPYGECTIDRIDVDGNYEPSNCRFVNVKVQANNRRKKTVKQ